MDTQTIERNSTVHSRVLPPRPVADLDAARALGAGEGLAAAVRRGPSATIDELVASGLRGRGGGGFPTGTKWRTVAEYAAQYTEAFDDTAVVVNGAEGEPGTFKDRMVLRTDPYKVLEGGLIAAHSIGAATLVIAVRASFATEIARLERAIAEVEASDWPTQAGKTNRRGTVDIRLVAGPEAYLFGEETAMLEVLDGRRPFPRTTPPYLQGLRKRAVAHDGIIEDATESQEDAGTVHTNPTIVNNVETMANVPGIIARGASWFRELGTDESPGTVLVTLSGDIANAGVFEVPMGTPLRSVLEDCGGGVDDAADGRRISSVLSGVANPLLLDQHLDTPLTHEDLAAVGSGLGAAGFIVFDDRRHPVSIAHGVARFLAIESCGQCTPCKTDGLEIASRLDSIRGPGGTRHDLEVVHEKLLTVADGARCSLAIQHEQVVGSILANAEAALRDLVGGETDPIEPLLIAPIVDLDRGIATLDQSLADKQPDWSHDRTDSGTAPAEQ